MAEEYLFLSCVNSGTDRCPQYDNQLFRHLDNNQMSDIENRHDYLDGYKDVDPICKECDKFKKH